MGRGRVLLVHASLRAVGWICGGSVAMVQALLDVLGPSGTLVVPTFTSDNRDPRLWSESPQPQRWWDTIREHLPAFDPARSPGHRMGALSEQVRTWPGARRSAHPQTSFTALGRDAEVIVDGHDLSCHLGPRSPLGRLDELDAQALLLGVNWNRCTTFHLGEYRQAEPPRRRYACVVRSASGREWCEFEDVSLSDEDFDELGRDYEGSLSRTTDPGLSVGTVGAAPSTLFSVPSAVRFATSWLADRRPPGADRRPPGDGSATRRPVRAPARYVE